MILLLILVGVLAAIYCYVLWVMFVAHDPNMWTRNYSGWWSK